MSFDTIVNLVITVDSRAPSQEGFGTPMLFGYHRAWLGDRMRTYAQPDEMLLDGFDAEDDLYKAASIVKSQKPCPDTFKVGRREVPLTQVIELSPFVTKSGFVYKGLIGGKTLSYVVPDDATESTIAAGLVAAINTLAAGTTAAAASAGASQGTNVGPWSLASGDTLLVAADADVPGSPHTATFTATAAARESAAENFSLVNGQTLTVRIDGGAVQTITFGTASFVAIGAATAEEVAAVINAGIVGARATVTSSGTKVTITSDRKGTGSGVNVTGGTANAALGFATGNLAGTGNVSNISAVNFAEVKSIVEAAVTGVTVLDAGGAAKIVSNTTGASSKVLVTAASTADDELGFDNAEHTGAAGGPSLTCTADDPGKVVAFALGKGIAIRDLTADTTTGAELSECLEEDDDWYGLSVIDSSSKATIVQSAAWEEARRKIALFQTPDDDAADGDVDDDVLSTLLAASYSRSGTVYHRFIGGNEWLATALLARFLTTQPGESTLAFKEAAGVTVDKLSTGQDATILAKNGSHYTRTGGLNILFEGKMASGRFLDSIRNEDWLYARMREEVLSVLAANEKIPYTDNGVDIMRIAVETVLQRAVTAQYLKADPAPVVTAPKVKDVPSADRKNRRLPDIVWEAEEAGAIHGVKIRGRISV